MPNEESREVARIIYESSEDLHELQQGDTLAEKARDACTAYQQIIVDEMVEEGYAAGLVSDADAKVEDLDVRGHTVGFVKTGNGSEMIAFDATIAQNGQYHRRRKARVWFGDAVSLSKQLKSEFGGKWDIFQIKGAVGDFA